MLISYIFDSKKITSNKSVIVKTVIYITTSLKIPDNKITFDLVLNESKRYLFIFYLYKLFIDGASKIFCRLEFRKI